MTYKEWIAEQDARMLQPEADWIEELFTRLIGPNLTNDEIELLYTCHCARILRYGLSQV